MPPRISRLTTGKDGIPHQSGGAEWLRTKQLTYISGRWILRSVGSVFPLASSETVFLWELARYYDENPDLNFPFSRFYHWRIL
jgi:hypothetical protein